MSGVLDGGSIGQGIAKWHAQFYDVGSGFGRRQDDFDALGCAGIAAHEIGDEYSTPLVLCLCEGLCNLCCWKAGGARRAALHGCYALAVSLFHYFLLHTIEMRSSD